jgi:hypothetical protein
VAIYLQAFSSGNIQLPKNRNRSARLRSPFPIKGRPIQERLVRIQPGTRASFRPPVSIHRNPIIAPACQLWPAVGPSGREVASGARKPVQSLH